MLQWGHARMSVETEQRADHLRAGAGASMGPRSDERGNLGRPDGNMSNALASMGPRSDERGNIGLDRIGAHVGGLLQWGHARMSVETRSTAVHERRNTVSFNGATLG